MARPSCGRCFEPTPATTVERISFGESTYKIPLCDEHANRMQRDFIGWARCGEIIDDALIPAPARPEPVAPQRWTRIQLPPAVPTQPAARVTRRRRSTLQMPLAFFPQEQRAQPAVERTADDELDLGLDRGPVDRGFKVKVPPPLPSPLPRAFTNPFAIGPEPVEEPPPAPDPMLSLPDGIGAHRACPRPGHPLPDDWERWRFSDHATLRRRERRVSPAEVLWAACHPDVIRPGKTSDTVLHIREHVHVVLNPSEDLILTVANRRLDTSQEGTYAHVAS